MFLIGCTENGTLLLDCLYHYMTVPDSWEGSTNIDERWTEAGVLGGADSSIGDSNLVGAGSRLKQKKFFKRMIHKSSNMPLDLDRVTSPTQLPIRRSFSVVLKFNPLVSVLNTWGTIIETAMQFFQMAKNCFRNGKMDSKGTGLVFVWATSVPNGTP